MAPRRCARDDAAAWRGPRTRTGKRISLFAKERMTDRQHQLTGCREVLQNLSTTRHTSLDVNAGAPLALMRGTDSATLISRPSSCRLVPPDPDTSLGLSLVPTLGHQST